MIRYSTLVSIESFKNTAIFKIVSSASEQLAFTFRTHGGARLGAGRKPASPRPPVHHVKRPALPAHCPSHVTLRIRHGFPSLRNRRFVSEFRRSLREACERGAFRVCHYSVQRDHVHLVVEAAGKESLADGMKAVASRIARAVNRVFGCRGPVLFGRYHTRVLRTPREVRHALAYVLLNVRKHWRQRNGVAPPVRLDAASSGAWFDGWRRLAPVTEPRGVRDVALPRTWLLGRGWRDHGLVDPAEVPGFSNPAPRRGHDRRQER